MNFRIDNKTLEKIDTNAEYNSGFSLDIVKAFRKRMQAIRAARDEGDLRAMKSYRFEKLKGKRQHEYSIRLNDKYRLIFEIEEAKAEDQSNRIVVKGIEDYH
jgi:toxin HigB-1